MNASQRTGVTFLIVLIIVLALGKKPFFDYIQKKNFENKKSYYLNEIQDFKTDKTEIVKHKVYSKTNKDFTKIKSKKEVVSLDINSANEEQFKALPGIGEKLSKRIIAFRTKLGGFYSIEQIKDVYGITPETYELIENKLYVSKDYVPKKININNASETELDVHPYISAKLASQIAKYRDKAGNYTDVSQLKKMYAMNDTLFQKLSPYLTIH
jgi:competence ComEA-like helix-hairpin-helix protein